MRLVEDVDLVASGDGRVGDLLAQLADVVDGVVGGRVHLDHVERGGAGDRHARVADAARRDRRSVDAVQAGREDLGHARLAGPAGADEQVRVVDLALLNGVGERAHDVLLADHVGERARAVATVERGACGHCPVESSRRSGARTGRASTEMWRRTVTGAMCRRRAIAAVDSPRRRRPRTSDRGPYPHARVNALSIPASSRSDQAWRPTRRLDFEGDGAAHTLT